MFWYDKEDERATYCDVRQGVYGAPELSGRRGKRHVVVRPDVRCDFTSLPFADESVWHVVFDPPHLLNVGPKAWMAACYGKLEGDWREMLRKGFEECFRVLKPHGTLIFKWGSRDVALREVLALTPEKPLYGHRSGKRQQTHWIAFIKGGKEVANERADGDG